MATTRALRLVVSRPSAATQGGVLAAHRRLLSAVSTEASGAGDPAVHSGDAPSDDYMDRPPRFSGAEEATSGGRRDKRPVWEAEAAAELADPAAGASFTQKRRVSSGAAQEREPREAATPGASEAAARKVREEDREYYRTRKPSPLAEVEFADTRKPITRATDGNASDRYSDVQGRMVEDTVDDSLARAEAMVREAAARGIPEWPHSRALAEMLARRQQQQGEDAASANSACWGT